MNENKEAADALIAAANKISPPAKRKGSVETVELVLLVSALVRTAPDKPKRPTVAGTKILAEVGDHEHLLENGIAELYDPAKEAKKALAVAEAAALAAKEAQAVADQHLKAAAAKAAGKSAVQTEAPAPSGLPPLK